MESSQRRDRILIRGIDVLTCVGEDAGVCVLRGVDIGIEDGKIAFVESSGTGGGCRSRSGDSGRSQSGGAARPRQDVFTGSRPGDFSPDYIIDGSGRLAIPGLVNTHCHTAMTLLRGCADDIPLEPWLFEKIFPAEARLTEEDIYWGTQLGIAEMLRGGVTFVNDMYLKMDSVAAAFENSKIRASVSIGPLLTEKRGDALVDIEGCKSFFKKWNGASDGRMSVNMEIHSIYLYTKETLIEGARLAEEIGAPIHIHILETAAERSNMLEKYGKSSVELAFEWGLFNVPVIAAHCVHTDANDIAILKEKGVSVAHNPSSNLKLASGVAPIPEMLERGVNVCLGTDGAASNNMLDIFMEMRLAALIHKGVNMVPTLCSAGKVFEMATRSGARALGADDTGVIIPGHKADITILSLDSPRFCPLHSHISSLVYAARADDVETVIVDGRVLMNKHELLTIDEEKVKHMAVSCAKKFEPKNSKSKDW